MYLEIDEGYFEHPRVLHLCSALRDDRAVIYPIRLWSWALRHSKNGTLRGLGADSIENIMRFDPKDGSLFRAMTITNDQRAGVWISDTDSGLVISGWDDRDGALIRRPKEKSSLYSGQLWIANRKLALARDGVCVECGNMYSLDVHHRKPARLFEDCELAHSLENLVVLCRKHHAQADALFRATGEIYSKSISEMR
jgi:hypothetical protein